MSIFFSIIVNVHNGERYLHTLFNSILNQTFTDYQLVLVDNFSSDCTSDIISAYKYSFSYIALHTTQELLPLYAARNIAVSLAEGQYIAFHDVDDVWTPDKLESYYYHLKSSVPNIAFGAYYRLNTKLTSSSKSKKNYNQTVASLDTDFFCSYNIAMSTLILSRKLFINSSFNPRYTIVGEFEFILRCLFGSQALIIQHPTCTVLQSNDSTSFKYPLLFSRELHSLAISYKSNKPLYNYLRRHSYYKLYQSFFLSSFHYHLPILLSIRLFKKVNSLSLSFRLFLVCTIQLFR